MKRKGKAKNKFGGKIAKKQRGVKKTPSAQTVKLPSRSLTLLTLGVYEKGKK